jgi:hypothetical protein
MSEDTSVNENGCTLSSTRYTEYEWKIIRSSVLGLEDELNDLSLNGRWEVFSVTSEVKGPGGPTDFVIVARR